MDWKHDINSRLEERAVEIAKRQEERARDEERLRTIAKQKEEALRVSQEAELLKVHQSRFRCAYKDCEVVSSGPGIREEWFSYNTPTEAGGGTEAWQKHSVTDWDIPTGLSQCKICQRWYCDEHSLDEICRFCWDTYWLNAPSAASDAERTRHSIERKNREVARSRGMTWFERLVRFLRL